MCGYGGTAENLTLRHEIAHATTNLLRVSPVNLAVGYHLGVGQGHSAPDRRLEGR